MSNIIIRPATLGELPILLEFEQAIIEYERPFEENMQSQPFSYYDLEQLIQSDQAEVLVADIDGIIIASGYAKIKQSLDYLNDETHSFLGFMFVAEDHRGKGVNQLIIDRLIEWSRSKKMTSISLTVFEQNASAIKAYRKLGFEKQLVEMRMNLND